MKLVFSLEGPRAEMQSHPETKLPHTVVKIVFPGFSSLFFKSCGFALWKCSKNVINAKPSLEALGCLFISVQKLADELI